MLFRILRVKTDKQNYITFLIRLTLFSSTCKVGLVSGNEESISLYNPSCVDVKYPGNEECVDGWKYFDGTDWMDEETISITCTIKGGNRF